SDVSVPPIALVISVSARDARSRIVIEMPSAFRNKRRVSSMSRSGPSPWSTKVKRGSEKVYAVMPFVDVLPAAFVAVNSMPTGPSYAASDTVLSSGVPSVCAAATPLTVASIAVHGYAGSLAHVACKRIDGRASSSGGVRTVTVGAGGGGGGGGT